MASGGGNPGQGRAGQGQWGRPKGCQDIDHVPAKKAAAQGRLQAGLNLRAGKAMWLHVQVPRAHGQHITRQASNSPKCCHAVWGRGADTAAGRDPRGPASGGLGAGRQRAPLPLPLPLFGLLVSPSRLSQPPCASWISGHKPKSSMLFSPWRTETNPYTRK